MAAPFLTSYYVGIGTAISAQGVPTELSGGSYARQACGFTGTAISGLTQSFSAWVVATAPTPAVPCFYGLMYDALTGGNLVAYWTWNPTATGSYTGSLTAFPATVVNITFNTYISTALNIALTGGQGSSGSLLDGGAQIGVVNGNPMLAGCRLGIGAGGTLVPHIGAGQWIASADVQGTLYANAFATSNIANSIAANSTNSQAAGTLLTGAVNIVTTGGTAYSVTLPGPTLSPGAPGTWLTVINNTTTSLSIYPDSGAQINGGGANTVLTLAAVATGRSAQFFRVNATNWYTVPAVAS